MSIVAEVFLNFFDKSMPRKTEVQSSTKKEHHLLQILWPPLHLILEECHPVSRQVSFHKRRSSVRKSEKDAI